jgi:TolB-like protein
VVEKAELMKLVWPDTVVEEVGLARNVSLLRKVLADYIETIPRRGYRFAAEDAAPPKRWRWVAAAVAAAVLGGLVYWQFYVPSRFVRRGAGVAALAVVPFDGRPDVTDALVTQLSKLDGVQVVSPTTVRRHQKIGNSMGLMGRLLGLDVLVEGAVREVGDRRRITARLVDVHTGKVIWSETYDRAAAEADWVVPEIATQVAAHLAIHGEFSAKR